MFLEIQIGCPTSWMRVTISFLNTGCPPLLSFRGIKGNQVLHELLAAKRVRQM